MIRSRKPEKAWQTVSKIWPAPGWGAPLCAAILTFVPTVTCLAQGQSNVQGTHMSAEQIQDLITKTDDQIVKDPSNGKLYARRANLEHFAGLDQKALNDLDKAIELDPNDVMSLGERSSLYARMRNSLWRWEIVLRRSG